MRDCPFQALLANTCPLINYLPRVSDSLVNKVQHALPRFAITVVTAVDVGAPGDIGLQVQKRNIVV